MSQPLIIRPEAEADLADAYDWYEERVAGLGTEFLDRVEIVLGAIAEHPELYPTILRNVRRALTRRFPYQVLYIVSETSVSVLAVFHTGRDPKHWKERI